MSSVLNSIKDLLILYKLSINLFLTNLNIYCCMTFGNVVHSQTHLGHNVYKLDHCEEYFYISLLQLEVYVLKFLVVDVLHSALLKDNTRN